MHINNRQFLNTPPLTYTNATFFLLSIYLYQLHFHDAICS